MEEASYTPEGAESFRAQGNAEKSSETPEQQRVREIVERDLRAYKEAADSKGIKEVGGDWLVMDGVQADSLVVKEDQEVFSGDSYTTPLNTDGHDMPEGRLESVGTYYSNNSVIAFVDGEGHLRVGPATKERHEALEEAGYVSGFLGVPLSNGELPIDPTLRGKWELMVDEGRVKRRQEKISEDLEAYQKAAQEKGIKEVGGDWLTMDGVQSDTLVVKEDQDVFSGNSETTAMNTDGYNRPSERVDSVGTYDENNGVIAFVDGEGHLRVGPATDERHKALQEAGYVPGSLGVPLSNGDLPVDPTIRVRWEGMVEETRKPKS